MHVNGRLVPLPHAMPKLAEKAAVHPPAISSIRNRTKHTIGLRQLITKLQEKIKKQKTTIHKLRQMKYRFQKKNEALNAAVKEYEAKDEVLSREHFDSIDPTFKAVLSRFFMLISGQKVPQTYSPDERKFVLTMNHHSPKAYRFLRSKLNNCLPHPKTITQWYKCVDGEPGISAESMWLLEQKVANSDGQIVVALLMDEMSIKKKVDYNGQRVDGYVNIGQPEDIIAVDTTAVAKEALVFMVSSMEHRWKIPVAYYLINSLTSDDRRRLLVNCIECLQSIGIVVSSITFDGLYANQSMVKMLGCRFDEENMQTWFELNGQNVAVLYDPCHMIKLIRNAFGEKKKFVDDEGKTISWQYIEELHKLQESEELHFANRLRGKHVHYENNKMKVHLATQLFSKSVADALEFCNKLGLPQFEGSEATIRFIRNVNDSFDVLNSRSLNCNEFKRAIDEETIEVVFNIIYI